MSTIFDQYYASLLADASYVKFGDFGTIPPGGVLTRSTTLGAKLAAGSYLHPRWEPIKSFPHDDTEVGVNRLIDAMSSFGVEPVTDSSWASADRIDRGALEQLTANHEISRTQTFRTEFRALLD